MTTKLIISILIILFQNNLSDLCCKEAGLAIGLNDCRCRRNCAGNPCNAGQGRGLGGGRFCETGVCCCGDGCRRDELSNICPLPTNEPSPPPTISIFETTTTQAPTNNPNICDANFVCYRTNSTDGSTDYQFDDVILSVFSPSNFLLCILEQIQKHIHIFKI
eukprot:71721_1